MHMALLGKSKFSFNDGSVQMKMIINSILLGKETTTLLDLGCLNSVAKDTVVSVIIQPLLLTFGPI